MRKADCCLVFFDYRQRKSENCTWVDIYVECEHLRIQGFTCFGVSPQLVDVAKKEAPVSVIEKD